MRRVFRLIAFAIAFGCLVFWLFGGPHLGWTKTTVERKKHDPVTDIDYSEIVPQFIPGVDFLAAGWLAGAVLFGASFVFRKPSSNAEQPLAKNKPRMDTDGHG